MAKIAITAVLAWALACANAFAQTEQDKAAAPDTPARNSVKLTAVYVELPPGTLYASVARGALCIGNPITETWLGGRHMAQNFLVYRVSFKAEMEGAGYKVVTPSEDNLFDREAGSADDEIAGVIIALHVNGCLGDGFYTLAGSLKGEASTTID